jgi:CRP/FNR family cyclic AMP-dependent transcriptional regulator
MLVQLGRYSLFDDLSEDDLALAAPYFSDLQVPAGQILFRQNEAADLFYLVVTGQVALRYKPYDGPEIGLNRVPAGGAVGWSAVTGGPVYTATAISGVQSELLTVHGSDLRRLLVEHPAAGQKLLKRLAMAVSPRWEGAYRQVMNMISRGVTH